MNILYIGNAQGFSNANKFYLIPQKLINGFVRNGHNVYVFNDRDYTRASNLLSSSKFGHTALNRKVIDICKDFAPDLIILGHCKHVWNDTLNYIRTVLPNVKIVYRNVDPLNSEKNRADISQRTNIVDGIFITTAGEAIQQFSSRNTFVSYMPNPIDSSIENAKAFDNDPKYDLFFAGSVLRDQYDQRHDTLKYLEQHLGTEMNLNFIGSGISETKLFGVQYIECLKRSAMGLCLNKTSDYYLYASDRMAQYLGFGLLVFIDRKSGFQDIFSEDEIAFYSSEDELTEKVFYYHKNDSERRAAAERAWQKAHKLYDCQLIAQFILERTFDRDFTYDYDWASL